MNENQSDALQAAREAVNTAAGLNGGSSRYYVLRDAVDSLLRVQVNEIAAKLRTEIRNATGTGREDWAALVREVDRLVDTIDPKSAGAPQCAGCAGCGGPDCIERPEPNGGAA